MAALARVVRLAAFLTLAVPLAISAQPRPDGYVTDRAGLLSGPERQAIEARLAAFDDSTSVQIAVLTVPDLAGEAPDAFALRLMRRRGPGRPEVNNGLVVLLAAAERRVQVQVGTGLEWQIPDSVAADIVGLMTAEFREGQFAQGLGVGIEALAERAASVPWAVPVGPAQPRARNQIVRLCGPYRDGAVTTASGPVQVAFPPHWAGAFDWPRPGDGVRLVGRIVGLDPARAQVLGVASPPCGSGP